MTQTYCESILHYRRRRTREVKVGNVGVGGDNPIRVQSMTIADTMDTEATVAEVVQLVEAGCEIVRITAPSIREAENLKNIKEYLLRQGVTVPLVADIHFTPNAALIAADYVEKVRINPGNYADKKRFEQREYTDEDYARELLRIEEKFVPLVLKCKKLGRAMRIGTNHGSLSDRIMNRYGDTAGGMVESALEFVRICRKHDYHDIILSMKSSNPLVAIQAYRLLAARMDELGMDYPFHLGVTEAGDGLVGRIKSAVGIGGLLEDGIGDTIRVSLTEAAVEEVPVAFRLVEKFNNLNSQKQTAAPSTGSEENEIRAPKPFEYDRRQTLTFKQVYHKLGTGFEPRVSLSLKSPVSPQNETLHELAEMLHKPFNGSLHLLNGNGNGNGKMASYLAETVYVQISSAKEIAKLRTLREAAHRHELWLPFAVDVTAIPELADDTAPAADRLVFSPTTTKPEAIDNILNAAARHGKSVEWRIMLPADSSAAFSQIDELLETILTACNRHDFWNILFSLSAQTEVFSFVQAHRYLAGRLDFPGANLPILLRYRTQADREQAVLEAASQLGALFCDGIGDAIHIEADLPNRDLLQVSYDILQATRLRISKTDYISCPSCGRTLFDLQSTTERIKSKTDHLKGVKIAIMGCIVNGPGEMADADFGYVGAGPKKVNLFVGKDCVARNIPESEADERLIALIKDHGRWVEA